MTEEVKKKAAAKTGLQKSGVKDTTAPPSEKKVATEQVGQKP
jgi:hypothetical protein